MKRARFRLEPLSEAIFEGCSDGRKWNGWACPVFAKDQADKIVEAWHALGYKADYEQSDDVYRFAPIDQLADPNPDLADEEVAEHFGAIIVDGMNLYRIGTAAWVWEEANVAVLA